MAVFSVVSGLCSKENELIIVSPHWEGIQYEFGRAFEAWYQENVGKAIRVRWRDLGGASQIEKALVATYQATPDSCGMDVFFGGGMDPFENLHRRGLLYPYRVSDEVLKDLPESFSGVRIIGEDYAYYGTALSSFGILENRRVTQRLGLPEVKTWRDLADSRLAGWVSSTDPRKSGSVHMIYEIILQAYGWDEGWGVIYGMSGNVRSFLQNSSAPVKEVSAGDAAFAVTIDINGLTQQSFLGEENVIYRIPRGVSVVTPDGIAILRGAPNLEAAKLFVEFVLSEKGQKLWMKPKGTEGGALRFNITRMGVLPKLYPNDLSKLLVPFNPFQVGEGEIGFRYNSELGSRRWHVLNDLIGQTIIDVHRWLRRAWRAASKVQDEVVRQELLRKIKKPFVTESEAIELASYWRKDKVRARRMANEWMEGAVRRYQEVIEVATKFAVIGDEGGMHMTNICKGQE
ncbi:MAG: ABC transporter substrate-binding protein [Methylacidiphilales bacterium]|nr:ABC transporter substrate-binding protein [Candidatus Methylacidiphilales bacterium]MDW8348896.1 ABC transporter substrate-binding protein [Verrucomicrobiae bacterium]